MADDRMKQSKMNIMKYRLTYETKTAEMHIGIFWQEAI